MSEPLAYGQLLSIRCQSGSRHDWVMFPVAVVTGDGTKTSKPDSIRYPAVFLNGWPGRETDCILGTVYVPDEAYVTKILVPEGQVEQMLRKAAIPRSRL